MRLKDLLGPGTRGTKEREEQVSMALTEVHACTFELSLSSHIYMYMYIYIYIIKEIIKSYICVSA